MVIKRKGRGRGGDSWRDGNQQDLVVDGQMDLYLRGAKATGNTEFETLELRGPSNRVGFKTQ
jgi:hypothetical protein